MLGCAAVVTVADVVAEVAEPVRLPVIVPLTVKLDKVPTLVIFAVSINSDDALVVI